MRNETFELSRRASVFDGPADMVYLGIEQAYTLVGTGRFAICGARANRQFPNRRVAAADVPWSCAAPATAVARCTTSAPQAFSRPTR